MALSLGDQHMENAAAGFLGVVEKPPSPSVPQSSPFEGDRKMKLIIIEKEHNHGNDRSIRKILSHGSDRAPLPIHNRVDGLFASHPKGERMMS